MNKQLEIYKRLHGKHTCRHHGCNTVSLAAYCKKHKAAMSRAKRSD
jgi:hypothetical protein